MYVIIVGGGQIGYYLAKGLLDEGHEILVVEKDSERIDFITNELGSVCYRGDGCEVSTLVDVGASRADMLVAVTANDEDNLVTCQLAKYKFKVPRTIARLRNPKNEHLFRMLGVDVTVSTTDLILEVIEKEVPTHAVTHLMTIPEREAEIIYVKIPPDSSVIGKRIRDIPLPKQCLLGLIIGKELPRLPRGDIVIEAGDHIIAVTSTSAEQELIDVLTGRKTTRKVSTP